MATLAPYVESGVPVIGLEPSCLATLRSDAAELTGSTVDVLSLAELVEREQLPAARPHRGRGGRPAALPPPRRHRLGRRPAAARARRRDGHPGRRLLRPGRQLRHGEGPLRGLGRGRRDPPAACRARAAAAPSCSPTACPAGSSSTTWPAFRPCTSRSCWLRPSGSARRTPISQVSPSSLEVSQSWRTPSPSRVQVIRCRESASMPSSTIAPSAHPRRAAARHRSSPSRSGASSRARRPRR